ncbi:MAG: hypothetical protein JAY74_19750 [Candidatus Thiodiazotropha taylori]|nr:hypothetical protein [Candidatus Thiodiazotropha taylori]
MEMKAVLVSELNQRIEQLASSDSGVHRCFVLQQPGYCRAGLVHHYPEAFQDLISELLASEYASHYETLLYSKLRSIGWAHNVARAYADIRRLRDFMRENFIALFDTLWVSHPEQIEVLVENEPLVEVDIEVATSEDGVSDVIEID